VTRLRAKVGDLYVFSTGPSYGPEGAIVLSPGFFNPGTDHLGRRALTRNMVELRVTRQRECRVSLAAKVGLMRELE
jgi:hypothetical protein